MAKVLLEGWRCERCAHEWVPREKDKEPKVCPCCKSPYWDRPRRDDADVAMTPGALAPNVKEHLQRRGRAK